MGQALNGATACQPHLEQWAGGRQQRGNRLEKNWGWAWPGV